MIRYGQCRDRVFSEYRMPRTMYCVNVYLRKSSKSYLQKMLTNEVRTYVVNTTQVHELTVNVKMRTELRCSQSGGISRANRQWSYRIVEAEAFRTGFVIHRTSESWRPISTRSDWQNRWSKFCRCQAGNKKGGVLCVCRLRPTFICRPAEHIARSADWSKGLK
jgi:hypothetical protein